MEEIFEFIEDASCALDLLSRYYRISYDESKIVYAEDGNMIDDGETEELGWRDSDIYSMVAKEDGSRYTFNDACEQLINKYVESTDIFSEDNKSDGRYYASLIETQFLKIDEVQRKALIKKIVRSSFIFLMPSSYPLYEIIQPSNTYGVFAYRCFMSDEEIEEYERKDEIGMYKALPMISWLIEECCNFLNAVGTICSDYDMNLLDVAKSVFSYTTLPLRFDVFGDDVKLLKNSDDAQGQTNQSKKKQSKKRVASMPQQWDFLYAILHEIGWNKGAWNNTDIADFASFLFGCNNQNIRSLLSNDDRTDETKMKSADIIGEYLNKIGLDRIAQKIKDNAK